MSTTRSQKRRNNQQESTGENVSESLISPIGVGNPCSLNQDDGVAGLLDQNPPGLKTVSLKV